MIDGPFTVDVQGNGSTTFPTHYIIQDRCGRIVCDTYNVWQFDVREQRAMMEALASALNRELAASSADSGGGQR